MTDLLTKAFKKASTLPDHLQDELAVELLDELEWEMKWNNTLKNSQSILGKMASKAVKDYREGKTPELGFDEL